MGLVNAIRLFFKSFYATMDHDAEFRDVATLQSIGGPTIHWTPHGNSPAMGALRNVRAGSGAPVNTLDGHRAH